MLVGSDLCRELRWISQECPSFISLFKIWVDLKDIASKSCGRPHPGLFDTMRALGISDSPSPVLHRAANDAVRCFAVFAGLMTLDSSTNPSKDLEGRLFIISPKDRKCRLLHQRPRLHKRHPFTARITTADGSILPSNFDTPHSLFEVFREFDPATVALNSHGILKNNGVKVWWFSFSGIELLKHFVTETHGSILGGKVLVVEGGASVREKQVQKVAL